MKNSVLIAAIVIMGVAGCDSHKLENKVDSIFYSYAITAISAYEDETETSIRRISSESHKGTRGHASIVGHLEIVQNSVSKEWGYWITLSKDAKDKDVEWLKRYLENSFVPTLYVGQKWNSGEDMSYYESYKHTSNAYNWKVWRSIEEKEVDIQGEMVPAIEIMFKMKFSNE